MESKVFETLYGTADYDGHHYEIHQFVQWYGYLPYFAQGKTGGNWNDWYLVRASTPCNSHVGALRYRDPELERIRKASGEKDAIFYNRDEGVGIIVYKDGVPMTEKPLTREESWGMPEEAEIVPVNDFWAYRQGTFKRTFEDPFKIWDTEEYEKFFTPRFKVGDTVFCLLHHDSETRCGERWQIEHMKIENISIDMGRILYYNNTDDFFSIDHISVRQLYVGATVEELIERFGKTYGKLYMWRPGRVLGIVECTSTQQYRNAWMREA